MQRAISHIPKTTFLLWKYLKSNSRKHVKTMVSCYCSPGKTPTMLNSGSPIYLLIPRAYRIHCSQNSEIISRWEVHLTLLMLVGSPINFKAEVLICSYFLPSLVPPFTLINMVMIFINTRFLLSLRTLFMIQLFHNWASVLHVAIYFYWVLFKKNIF